MTLTIPFLKPIFVGNTILMCSKLVELTSFFRRVIAWGILLTLTIAFTLSCQSPKKETLFAEDASNFVAERSQISISFETLSGDHIALTPMDNHLTVLHFWATWCKPCLAEFPELKQAMPLLENDSVQFLIASDEELELIGRFQKKYATGLKLIRMKEGTLADFDIYALPTTIILDRKGKEVFRHAGQLPWTAYSSIDELISKIP